MFNFLLDVKNSSVAGGTTSPDSIPGGIATGLDFDATAFFLGIVVGVIITFTIIGVIKYVKFLIKDNKEIKERLNSQKSDE